MLIVLLLWGLKAQVGWLIGVILEPITNQPKVELVLVMIVIPTIFNALQYWIVDSFIQKRKKKKKEAAERKDSKRGTSDTASTSLKNERLILLENYT